MKARFSMLGALFASLSIIGLPATASTPDGQTPAEETICNPLMAEDVSNGLYGLCIAFCEAQDADEDYPVTDIELAMLEANPPSRSILDAYNNIKKDSDPDMPCIAVDSSCPCWTAEELAAIDGVINNAMVDLTCEIRPDGSFASVEEEVGPDGTVAAATKQFNRCSYISSLVPDTGTITITSTEAAACVQQITDHVEEIMCQIP